MVTVARPLPRTHSNESSLPRDGAGYVPSVALHTTTIRLGDRAYTAIARAAEALGISVSQFVGRPRSSAPSSTSWTTPPRRQSTPHTIFWASRAKSAASPRSICRAPSGRSRTPGLPRLGARPAARPLDCGPSGAQHARPRRRGSDASRRPEPHPERVSGRNRWVRPNPWEGAPLHRTALPRFKAGRPAQGRAFEPSR
jgi:hypothetical protein